MFTFPVCPTNLVLYQFSENYFLNLALIEFRFNKQHMLHFQQKELRVPICALTSSIIIIMLLKIMLLKMAQSCPTLRPHGLQPTRSLPPWDSPGKSTGVGCHFPSPGDLPDPRIEPGSPAFQVDALTSEPPGKSLISSTCFSFSKKSLEFQFVC